MTPETYDFIRTVVQVVAFAGAVLLGIRSGWFKLNKDTVDTYKDALEALELKVTSLEERIAELEKVNLELKGEIEGKEKAIDEIVTSVAGSGLCLNAWDCANRVIPVDGQPHTHRRKRDKENDTG